MAPSIQWWWININMYWRWPIQSWIQMSKDYYFIVINNHIMEENIRNMVSTCLQRMKFSISMIFCPGNGCDYVSVVISVSISITLTLVMVNVVNANQSQLWLLSNVHHNVPQHLTENTGQERGYYDEHSPLISWYQYSCWISLHLTQHSPSCLTHFTSLRWLFKIDIVCSRNCVSLHSIKHVTGWCILIQF